MSTRSEHQRWQPRLQRRQVLAAIAAGGAWACSGRVPAATPPAREPSSRAALAPLPEATFARRLDRLRAIAHEAGAEATFVTSGTTSFAYLAGAPMERSERLIALMVPAEGEPILVAPSFELERVRRAVRVRATLRGWEEDESPFDVLRGALGARARGGVVVEPHTEYATATALARALPDVRLVDASERLESLRVVKDDAELARIRRAIAITGDAFDEAFARLARGVRDHDVAAGIGARFEREGVEGYALVQFGALSALPHGRPNGSALTEGTAVLIDGGCCVDGYWSDITRTRWFGGSPPEDFRRIEQVVRDAQLAGLARVRPGVAAQEIDRAARQVIVQAGYGAFFTHRTGHGLGMDGHEPIYLVEGNAAPLVAGCVFTIEPGIYLPGRFGVRIEDDVRCGEGGGAILTGA
jgi:Xaa-Pro dipeptidase